MSMKNIILFFLILMLFACDKNESKNLLDGNWDLVKIEVNKYASYDYTGDWSKLIMNFDGETLKYTSLSGINFFDTTFYSQKEFLYNLKLEINNNHVVIKCNKKDILTGIEQDTSYTIDYEEGNYDYTLTGGEKYNLKFEFGKNDYYIIGASDSDESNVLCSKENEIVNDSLKLSYYHTDYQPSTYYVSYEYTFHKVSD